MEISNTLPFPCWSLVYPWEDIGLQRSHIWYIFPWEVGSKHPYCCCLWGLWVFLSQGKMINKDIPIGPQTQTGQCQELKLNSHEDLSSSHSVKTMSLTHSVKTLSLLTVWRPWVYSVNTPCLSHSVKIPSPSDFYSHTNVFSSCWFSLPNLIISASPYPLPKPTRHYAQLLLQFPFVIEWPMN